ncbi:MAG TPA: hypothetical protein PLV06_06570 [Bacteroidales bacterium]|nr:hypothetical protein [Bacteroidales bacterium]HPR12029.1 hypothetical protein [Bacteroidales bacterium]
MKRFFSFFVIAALSAVLITGCKKDEDESRSLVMVKRSSGVLYTVDKSTGALTQKMTIMYNGSPLTGLRGLVYDPETGKCFSGATNAGGGNLYSIDLGTGEATLINDNGDDDWDAIADMVISSTGTIYAMIYSNIESASAITTINRSTGALGNHYTFYDGSDELYTAGGICFGDNESTLLIGSDESSIYKSGLTGGQVSATYPVYHSPSMNDIGDIYIMDLEKDSDGTVFAIVYDDEDSVQYLVKLDIASGNLTELKELARDSNSNFYHCLALIPTSKLN